MKNHLYLLTSLLILFIACEESPIPSEDDSINCTEFWAEFPFSDFCGLTSSNFDYRSVPGAICNAEQNESYSFDDRIYIQIYNNFSVASAKEEHDREYDLARPDPGFEEYTDVGDEAFSNISIENGFLDMAIMRAIKGQYSLYMEVNGEAFNTANNCLDKNSMLDFARALLDRL